MSIIVLMAYFMSITLVLYIISGTIYYIWYKKNYRTKEQTAEHDKGWDKCWKCKKAEPTMFVSMGFFGTIYYCQKCSKNRTST